MGYLMTQGSHFGQKLLKEGPISQTKKQKKNKKKNGKISHFWGKKSLRNGPQSANILEKQSNQSFFFFFFFFFEREREREREKEKSIWVGVSDLGPHTPSKKIIWATPKGKHDLRIWHRVMLIWVGWSQAKWCIRDHSQTLFAMKTVG